MEPSKLSPQKQVIFAHICQELEKASLVQLKELAKVYAFQLLAHQQSTQDLSQSAWFEHLQSAVPQLPKVAQATQAAQTTPKYTHRHILAAANRQHLCRGLCTEAQRWIRAYSETHPKLRLGNFRPSICTPPEAPQPAYKVLCSALDANDNLVENPIILEGTYPIAEEYLKSQL